MQVRRKGIILPVGFKGQKQITKMEKKSWHIQIWKRKFPYKRIFWLWVTWTDTLVCFAAKDLQKLYQASILSVSLVREKWLLWLFSLAQSSDSPNLIHTSESYNSGLNLTCISFIYLFSSVISTILIIPLSVCVDYTVTIINLCNQTSSHLTTAKGCPITQQTGTWRESQGSLVLPTAPEEKGQAVLLCNSLVRMNGFQHGLGECRCKCWEERSS